MKKKKKLVEQEKHFDDCGSDTGPIDDEATDFLLFDSHKEVDEIVDIAFPDGSFENFFDAE